MDFKERENLINFLKAAEKKYQVETWIVEGVEIWPIIKTTIFFSAYNQNKIESKNLKNKVFAFFKLMKLDFVYSYFWIKISKIRQVKYMFSGFSGHRVMLEGTFYNRYFDPIMDSLEVEKGYMSSIFEYERMKKIKHYRQDRVFDATKFVHYFGFKTRKIDINFEKFEKFKELLSELEGKLGILPETILRKISNSFHNVLIWKNLWLYVLDKSEAKEVFLLCYYDNRMYGLILAAKEKNILSVDMQHGGQSDFHPAYNFISVPGNGYKLLPDYFWTWEKCSYDNILKFTQDSSHKAIVGGNPWLESLKNKSVFLDDKKIVLYTMQTTLRPVLHSYIIEAIKNTPSDYNWWLRLHPRMTESEITELYKQLKDANISHKVEIEKATNLPLPLILANCTAHMSHFSGSIMEADLMNVRNNIILGEIGKKFYKKILDEKRARYYDIKSKENLYVFMQNELNEADKLKDGVALELNYCEAIKQIANEESNN